MQQLRTVELETSTGLVDQAKWFKALEQENGRLKKLVADLSLDNAILKEVAAGSGPAGDDRFGRVGAPGLSDGGGVPGNPAMRSEPAR